jgi:hypothetical protein
VTALAFSLQYRQNILIERRPARCPNVNVGDGRRSSAAPGSSGPASAGERWVLRESRARHQ